MSTNDTYTLQREHQDLWMKFSELMKQSKYLVNVVDALKRDNSDLSTELSKLNDDNENLRQNNEKLNQEINLLKEEVQYYQSHSKDLVLKLSDMNEQGTSASNENNNFALDYLLKRSKTGTRPSGFNKHIEEYKPSVCLVSSLPKSGTWANQYYWSVLDSLCKNGDTYDPYDAFFMQMEGFGVDLFAVAHFHCPGYADYASQTIMEKLDRIKYPSALSFDWGSKYMRDVGIDKACDPRLNPNTKIVFIYRNPLDQVLSYSRILWDPKFTKKRNIDVEDDGGSIRKVTSLKEYIREGGTASYVSYFTSYQVMKDVLKDRLMFVRYEDMIRKRIEKHIEIAEFLLGSEFVDKYGNELRGAEEITRIEHMKLMEKASGKTLMHNYKAPVKDKGGAHVHNGSIGQWKKVLDQDDIDFIFNMLDEFDISRDNFSFE